MKNQLEDINLLLQHMSNFITRDEVGQPPVGLSDEESEEEKEKKPIVKKKNINRVKKEKPVPQPTRRTKRKSIPHYPDDTRNETLNSQLESCRKVLRSLSSHRYSQPFMEPVDPVELQIPDYFDIIKHPMDLGTVSDRLVAGEYISSTDFAADVLLVFSNACRYNPPGNIVYKMAEEMREFFLERMKSIEEREKKKRDKLDGGVNALADSINSVQTEIEKLLGREDKETEKMNTNLPQPSIDIPKWSKADIKKLSQGIDSLSYEHFDSIMEIISQSNSSGSDNIYTSLDSLDGLTLAKLQEYVHRIQKEKNSHTNNISLPKPMEITSNSPLDVSDSLDSSSDSSESSSSDGEESSSDDSSSD